MNSENIYEIIIIKNKKKILLNRGNNYMISKMRLVGICYKGGQTLA